MPKQNSPSINVAQNEAAMAMRRRRRSCRVTHVNKPRFPFCKGFWQGLPHNFPGDLYNTGATVPTWSFSWIRSADKSSCDGLARQGAGVIEDDYQTASLL